MSADAPYPLGVLRSENPLRQAPRKWVRDATLRPIGTLRWSAIIGNEEGDLRIEESGPTFYGAGGTRLDAEELRQTEVGLLFADEGPYGEAEARLHQVREALMQATVPFVMTRMRFGP